MRKLWMLLLTACLLVTVLFVFPVNAQTAKTVDSGSYGNKLTWTIDNKGTLTISGTGAIEWGYDAPWNKHKNNIKSIVIKNGVRSIDDFAFAWTQYMTSVQIPASVTSIGDRIIEGCSMVTKIDVHKDNPMYSSIDGVLYNKTKTKLILVPHGITECKNIPSSVTSICDRAFQFCQRLTSITIPDGVTSIGNCAFADCDSLTSVVIPDSVTSIGEGAFGECFWLTSVMIPDSVNTIGEGAFAWCALKSVSIPDSVTSIGDYVFAGCNFKSVTIPDSVTSIGEGAFKDCSSLSSISIPDSVTSIGLGAFSGCSNLKYNTYSKAKYLGNAENPYVVLIESTSDSITSCKVNAKAKLIAHDAFSNCGKLKTITIPKGITGIGENAFHSCSSLTVITIPEGVISIGSGVFYNCESLKSISIPDSVTSIGDYAFVGCKNLNYTKYSNAKYLGNTNNPYLFLLESISDSITSCKIHPKTRFLNDYAFSECEQLETITIPDCVTTIGNSAFSRCYNLRSIAFEGDVTGIGTSAFWQCFKLKSITIPEGVTSIKEGTFDECHMLSSVTIPNSVTSIGDAAFRVCESLSAITIPDSVTGIGSNAFLGCDNLKTVYFQGDAPQINFDAFNGVMEANVYYPANDKTWKNVRSDYGGDLQWISYTPCSIVTQPANKTVKDGTSAKFTVKATGTGLKYQWQYRTSSTGSWKNASATGNKTATLSVPGTVSRHGYQYRCRVTDSAGNKVYTKAVTLNVLGIKTQPVSKTVVDGKTAKLTVSATGTGLKYQWQYRTSSAGSWKNASATGNKTKTLSVPASVSRHGYQYRCKITDSAGNTVYTKTVSLYVLGIKTQPASKTVKVGATAKFTVAATGTGLKFQWQYRTSSNGSWRNTSATGSKTKTLSVPGTTSRNGYQYRCKITDSAGNVIYTNAVKLTVKK